MQLFSSDLTPGEAFMGYFMIFGAADFQGSIYAAAAWGNKANKHKPKEDGNRTRGSLWGAAEDWSKKS